jgi:hypothetical protein
MESTLRGDMAGPRESGFNPPLSRHCKSCSRCTCWRPSASRGTARCPYHERTPVVTRIAMSCDSPGRSSTLEDRFTGRTLNCPKQYALHPSREDHPCAAIVLSLGRPLFSWASPACRLRLSLSAVGTLLGTSRNQLRLSRRVRHRPLTGCLRVMFGSLLSVT